MIKLEISYRGLVIIVAALLAIWAYQWGIPGGAIGLGAAISLVLFPLLTIVVAVVLFMLRRPE